MTTKKKIPWKCREHLFTSVNITVYEELLSVAVKTWIARPRKPKFKPRALRAGKVRWIMRAGKEVEC